ncbi:hypothetical protein ABEB36_002190 [Hypothenemus hampei]|uniref:Uncharacterized protein n=1 Tax=Hypothenemus hampei TaxID=57062 RepID=A0ABD1F4U5_HYPHA
MNIYGTKYNGIPIRDLYNLHAEVVPQSNSSDESQYNTNEVPRSLQMPIFTIEDLEGNLVDAKDLNTQTDTPNSVLSVSGNNHIDLICESHMGIEEQLQNVQDNSQIIEEDTTRTKWSDILCYICCCCFQI